MSEFQFNVYPKDADFAAATETCSVRYAHMGGILSSTVLREYFSSALGSSPQEVAGTAFIARHIEPVDFNDVPYDPRWGQAKSYMRGMHAGYDVMGIVQPIVTPREIVRTLVSGAAAIEGEYKTGLLSRPILMDMGLRGLLLVGAETRGAISQWAHQMSSNIEHGLMFKLGIGTVLHTADALHIQHNMQETDRYVSSPFWPEELQGLLQLNTGE
jgi:hypothetical protein